MNDTVEDRRFNITDPSGNTLIVGQGFEDLSPTMKTEEERMIKASPFEKSFKQAYRFAYSKEDFRAARNTLEYALLKQSDGSSTGCSYIARTSGDG